MTEILTSEEMRAVERAAMNAGSVTGLELMERAGRGVVEAIFETWPDFWGGAPWEPRTSGRGDAATGSIPRISNDRKPMAVVLCGPGNNGGDGFVVARLLKQEGWDVLVFLSGDPERLPPDARTNHDRWATIGTIWSSDDIDRAGGDAAEQADVIVDALFGIGLTRPVLEPQRLMSVVENRRERGARMHAEGCPKVVAIDMPSGVSSDTGEALESTASPDDPAIVVRADLTVTFHRLKWGHVKADGPEHCGKLIVKDIGL